MSDAIPRLFVLQRDRDVTGVSGPGPVADGVEWPDGTMALRWRERPSTSVWDSLDLMLSVHGHDGATRVVWADDRARAAAGRAYLLADRWQAAHGSSMFLVRAAGAELRDVLGEALAEDPGLAAAECSAQYPAHEASPRLCIRAAQHRGDHIDEHGFHWSDSVAVYPAASSQPMQHGRAYASSCSNPDHACPTCGDCVRQHPGEGQCATPNQGALAGIEVRDPCPWCEDCPLIPRTLMSDHIREHHPEVREGGPGIPVPDAVPELDDWVTEECPHCDERFPRNRIDEHVTVAHANLPPCTATLVSEHVSLKRCVFRAGHREGEYGSHHASAHGEMGRTVWADWATGATPHQEPDGLAAALVPPDGGIAEDGLRRRCEELHARLDDAEWAVTEAVRQRKAAEDRACRAESAVARVRALMPTEPCPTRGLPNELARAEAEYDTWEAVRYALDGDTREATEACPYCTGAPEFPRSELGAHVEAKHARVLDVLASGASLDERLAGPEARCRLPHEMEA